MDMSCDFRLVVTSSKEHYQIVKTILKYYLFSDEDEYEYEDDECSDEIIESGFNDKLQTIQWSDEWNTIGSIDNLECLIEQVDAHIHLLVSKNKACQKLNNICFTVTGYESGYMESECVISRTDEQLCSKSTGYYDEYDDYDDYCERSDDCISEEEYCAIAVDGKIYRRDADDKLFGSKEEMFGEQSFLKPDAVDEEADEELIDELEVLISSSQNE